MKAKKETWIRTAVLVFSLINQILMVCGINPLPFEEEAIYEGLSLVLTISAGLWNWWKNNSFTKEAIEADLYLDQLKEGKKNG